MLNRFFRWIAAVVISFSCAQTVLAQEKYDYQFQSLDILEHTVYNILIQEQAKNDSILAFWGDGYIMRIDSTSSNEWLLPNYFIVERGRDGRRIKSISTSQLTAEFRYGIRRKLKKIKFSYQIPADEVYFEGTIFRAEFNWNEGMLMSMEVDILFGYEQCLVRYY